MTLDILTGRIIGMQISPQAKVASNQYSLESASQLLRVCQTCPLNCFRPRCNAIRATNQPATGGPVQTPAQSGAPRDAYGLPQRKLRQPLSDQWGAAQQPAGSPAQGRAMTCTARPRATLLMSPLPFSARPAPPVGTHRLRRRHDGRRRAAPFFPRSTPREARETCLALWKKRRSSATRVVTCDVACPSSASLSYLPALSPMKKMGSAPTTREILHYSTPDEQDEKRHQRERVRLRVHQRERV